MKNVLTIIKSVIFLLSILIAKGNANAQESKLRWQLDDAGGITWQPGRDIPHSDHIEMSGQQISVVLRYGVNEKGGFTLNRSVVWPMLRMQPNETSSHLNRRFDTDIPGLLVVDGVCPEQETVQNIRLDGKMTVESSFSITKGGELLRDVLACTRICYPSTTLPGYYEEYIFKNTGSSTLTITIPNFEREQTTNPEQSVYGEYTTGITLSKSGTFTLKAGEVLPFYALFSGRKSNESALVPDIAAEQQARTQLVAEWWSSLELETPDPVLNRMFAFAKIRGAESIYKTKGGFMHGPGGERFYAAIWANDQAEYINPFFPFLGYETGNLSALNSFKHFARFMNPEYKPIPSSIIAEGVNIWHGAGDRGDGAMIAYGAARYALARGSREEAVQLWPLIEWCLEFCNRKITAEGVVASDSDELENRFPAGDANLCTAVLYYDALRSAIFLGKSLEKPEGQLKQYARQADSLEAAIENHFGHQVEGFETYRYYAGNDVLRAWICIPLTAGIYKRAESTTNALFSPRLWTKDGLLTQAGTSTFWDRSTLYALRGVIAAGNTQKGMDFLKYYSERRLLGDHVPYAIEAWPEGSQRHLSGESGLYCRIYTEGLFGIRPEGLKSFAMTPRLPENWQYMRLKKIKAFDADFDIEVTRKKEKLQISIHQNGKTVLKKTIKPGETIHTTLR